MIGVAVITVAAWLFVFRVLPAHAPAESSTTGHEDLISVSTPAANDAVTSPLTVTGEARGNWYFEASFPVRVLDANGTVLAAVPVQAQGEWMTENFVPFHTTLEFESPTTKTGTIVFQKDNPSGLPEFDDEIRIPVRFK